MMTKEIKVSMFARKDEVQAALEDRVAAQDFDAAVDYLRRFVGGGSIEMGHVVQALALVAVDPYMEGDAA